MIIVGVVVVLQGLGLSLTIKRDETETLIESNIKVRHVKANAVDRAGLAGVGVLGVDHLPKKKKINNRLWVVPRKN